MSTRVRTVAQSMVEIRTHFVDFADDLPAGITLSSATATHYPPSGSAATPTVSVAAAPIVQVKIGPLAVTGMHLVSVLATLSDAEKSEVLMEIPVNW